MTKYQKILDILNMHRDDLMTEDETHSALDKLQVRGGFDGTHYTGYDYETQEWIEY